MLKLFETMVSAVNAEVVAEQLMSALLPALMSCSSPVTLGRDRVRVMNAGSRMVVRSGPVAAEIAWDSSASFWTRIATELGDEGGLAERNPSKSRLRAALLVSTPVPPQLESDDGVQSDQRPSR